MPVTVNIPKIGSVRFPDEMALEDIERESASLYSRLAPGQPAPQYEGLLAGPPGFEQPARSPEELAAREQRARETTPGLPPEGTARPAGQVLTEPLVKLHRLTAQEVQDAWSFISAWGAAGEGYISPETAQEIAGAQSQKPGTAAKVTAGLINAAETVPETFTSLAGAAPLAAPGRLTSAGFALYMASQTPQAVTAWRDALKTGDPGTIAEASAGLALHGLMTFAAGKHAATSPRTIQAKQLAEALKVSEAEAGQLMATPEWKAAVDKAAAASVAPVRLIPQTDAAMREMGPFKGEFVETGPRAAEAKVEPPVVPPTRETVVPNVQTELEAPKPELQPATPELTQGVPSPREVAPTEEPTRVSPESPAPLAEVRPVGGTSEAGVGQVPSVRGEPQELATPERGIPAEVAGGSPSVKEAVSLAQFHDPQNMGSLLGAFQHAHKAGYTGREAQQAAWGLYSTTSENATIKDFGDWLKKTKRIEELMREPTKGVENARPIPSPESVPKLEVRPQVGESPPLRQPGEPAVPRPEAEREAPQAPPAEVKPVEAASKMQAEVSDVAKTESKRSAKEIKDDLIEEIQQRLQKAPAEAKEGDTVTIEIPGDGIFTVKNSIKALSGLLERARKLKTDIKPPKITKKQIKASENALRVSWTPRPEAKPSEPRPAETGKEIIGMGGAVKGEFEQKAQTATGIKNATVDEERAKRGLPPAMEPARRSFATVWDEAMSIVDREPERQDALIAELSEKPRAITDVEDALLLQRQIDLQNEFGKATRDLAQAYEDKRTADVADQRSRVDYLSDQLLKLYNINKSVGTETGRGLAARKMMAYEDFTLAAMETQKRAAKGGEPLTSAERTQIETLNKRIEETQKAYDAELARLQQRLSEYETQRLLDEEKAKAKPPEAPPEVKSLVERVVLTLEREADAARVRLREKFARTSAGVDPTILADVAIIGTAKLARGTLTLARWTEAMLKDLGEQVRPYLKDAWDMANKGLDTRIEQMAGSKQATPVKKAIKRTETAEIKKDATTRITAKVASNQTAEISPLVQKLARAIVSENPKITRDQLITEVHDVLKEIIPEMSRREVMDAISGYGQFKQLTKDEVSKTLRDLKGQMQQVAKIEDIESKKPPLKTGVERREPSAEERKLIKLVNEAKRRFGIVVTDPATQLKSALDARKTYYRNQIEDLQAQIDAKQKFVKTKTPSPTDAELESLKAQRDQIKKEYDALFPKGEVTLAQRAEMLRKALERSIAEYERRLKEGDFVTRKPKPFDVSQYPELIKLKSRNEALKEEFKKGLLLDRMKRRPIGQKIYDVAKEILNLPRNVLSSWDVSAVLRQGGFIVFGHPIRGARSLGPMFRALASEKAAREIDTQIHARPNATLYARSKLYLAPLEDLRLSAQEEMIMSRFAHRVPGLRASNRAFITFLNKLRADSFDTMTAALAKDRPLEQGELDAISNYINVATGRGNLGKAAAAAETLATIFFSPRLMASRFQLLAGEPLYRGSMRTRTAIAKEYGRLLIGLGVVYGLGQLAGATVEIDPRSSDFGKLRFGDTRVDPLMGLSQVTTLVSKVASGERKTAAGRVFPIRGKVPFGQQDTSDVVKQFLRSKLSPVVGGALDIATGKNVVGEKVTPSTVLTRLSVPLAFNDILDVMEENGIARGTAIEILSLFGMGVQNYAATRRPR